MKRFKVPSSNKKNFYIVLKEKDNYDCSCPSIKQCRHIRAVKSWIEKIKGSPLECFYCHNKYTLTEHHLLSGKDRKDSLTVWLCYNCHHYATMSIEFREHLRTLFIKHYGN